MSVIRLPGGKYRVQIRRKNLQLDDVFLTEAEAKDAEARALHRHTKADSLTLARLWEMYVGSTQFDDKSEQWAAAGLVDTDLSFLSLLELYGTEISERRMPTRRVVEALDVVEHI